MSEAGEPRRLLVIGAGVEQVRAYELAREMGLEVVGTDRNPDAPAFAHADHRIVADTHDIAGTVQAVKRFARRNPIHGVMTIAHDVPLCVATVAKGLGLPHLPIEAARLAQDKLAMKERFRRDGVAVPEFRRVESADEVRACLADWGGAVVIKPIDSCGARGVLRLTGETTNGVSVDEAFATARGYSTRGVVIAESFVPGLQLSTESMVWGGECVTASWSERNYDRLEEFAPHVIEDGGVLPATLTDDEVAAVEDLVARAARSLGIDAGPVKGDLVMGPDGPVVIEIAARLSGGYLCTDQIPYARGVDLVRQTIRLALGEELDPAELVPEHRSYLGVRFFFPPPGTVTSVEGYDELTREPWVLKSALYVGPGDRIEPTTSHPTRAGFAFTTGATPDEAESRARAAAARVTIHTVPHTSCPPSDPIGTGAIRAEAAR